MKKNPFTLAFGRKPLQYISRVTQTENIIDELDSDNPASQVYIITGVRGAGKTVMMTTVAAEFSEREDWLVVELNPNTDMLLGLAAKLYADERIHPLFLEARIDLSLLGIGASVSQALPVADAGDALNRLLKEIQAAGKRVLVTVDEAINNDNMRAFVSEFQILIRQEYDIFLLMTGLYNNIYDLQNDKSLTFLYRAPKVMLEPLNYTEMRRQYMQVFEVTQEAAGEMAALTKGYSFAFQVLGYLYWKSRDRGDISSILPEYDYYLRVYAYEKIWSELSGTDKRVLEAMAETTSTKVESIRKNIEMSSSEFSVYRERLLRKGLLDGSEYGHLKFALPRFAEFVAEM